MKIYKLTLKEFCFILKAGIDLFEENNETLLKEEEKTFKQWICKFLKYIKLQNYQCKEE